MSSRYDATPIVRSFADFLLQRGGAGAHRSGKRPRHVRLLGEARLYQEHHRIGLGDRILGTIVMHRQSEP